MRVRVIKPFTAYWNYSVTEFSEGMELEGGQARHFTDNAPEGSIEVLEHDPDTEAKASSGPDGTSKPGADGDGGDGQSEGDGQQEKEQSEGGEQPPVDGTIDQLMTWVAGDPDRAAAALKAEQAKDNPRSTAVKKLAELADSDKE